MGWTSTKKPANMTMKDFVLKMVFGPEKDRVVACVVKGGEAYMAVKEKATGKVYGMVVLIEKDKHYGDIAVKEMDEGMGPYYYNCPAKVLDLLDDPEALYEGSEYAKEAAVNWRAACREKMANKPPRLKKGLKLKLKEPIEFRNGATLDTVVCYNPRRLVFHDPALGGMYKIHRCYLEGAKAVA